MANYSILEFKIKEEDEKEGKNMSINQVGQRFVVVGAKKGEMVFQSRGVFTRSLAEKYTAYLNKQGNARYKTVTLEEGKATILRIFKDTGEIFTGLPTTFKRAMTELENFYNQHHNRKTGETCQVLFG